MRGGVEWGMHKLVKVLFGSAERSVITIAVLVVGIGYFLVPQLANLKVSFNEDLAAAPVTVTAGCSGNTAVATITWQSMGAPSDYWIDMGIYSGFKQYSSKNVSLGSFTTTAPNGFSPAFTLVPGTTYYVRVYHPPTTVRTTPVSFVASKCGGGGTPTPTPQSPLLSSLTSIEVTGRVVQDGSCSLEVYPGNKNPAYTLDLPVEYGTGTFRVSLHKNNNGGQFDVSQGSVRIRRKDMVYAFYTIYDMLCVNDNTCGNFSFSNGNSLENFHPDLKDAYFLTAGGLGNGIVAYDAFDLLSLKLVAGRQGTWESYIKYQYTSGTKFLHACTSRWIVDSVEGIK